MRQKVDRERKARESAIDRERQEIEKEVRRMKEKEEQNAREIAELRNKLSQASLMTPPQVNQNFWHLFYSCYIIKHDFQNFS